MIALLFALLTHELGHIMAILLTRAGRVEGVVVSWKGFGVKWNPYRHDPIKRAVVSLAGPGMNLLLAILFYSVGMEFWGLCNLIFGLTNLLLPFKQADGYRALRMVLDGVSQ